MNAFEEFLLGFAETVVATAPAVAPIFIGANNTKSMAIFNVSDAFMQAALTRLAPTAPIQTPPAAGTVTIITPGPTA